MRTVVLVAPGAYLAELKHAIHFPVARRIQAEGVRISRRQRLEVLEAEFIQDALSRVRNQSHHWTPPYCFVICTNTVAESVRQLRQEVDADLIAEVIVMTRWRDSSVGRSERLPDGLLQTTGSMKDRTVSDEVVSAVYSFATATKNQSRLGSDTPSAVRHDGFSKLDSLSATA